MRSSILILFLATTVSINAQKAYDNKEPLAHTYSIVARDPITGEMAAAVQSHWFSVGSIVIWGKSGVGVVATQSFVNPAYGPDGLDLMGKGKSAMEALEILVKKDEASNVRQLAFLDSNGGVVGYTGSSCIDHAGHIIGKNYSVQANMMLTDQVPKAMSEAYEANSHLPIAERVLEALKAAEAAGGDIRGRQSAALLVVSGKKGVPEWEDKLVQLRVDDHEVPLDELSRLLKVHRAYQHMNNGDLAVEHGDMEKAMDEYSTAQKMFPENQEMKFWTAVTLANNKQVEKASIILHDIYSKELGDNWKELLRRLPKVGLLNVTESELKKLLK